MSARSALLGLVVVGGLLAACSPEAASSAPDAGAVSYLFAVSSESGTIDGIGEDTGDELLTLTLTGASEHATQFADRPIRQAYVLSTADLVDRWGAWFADAPPNAVLSFIESGDALPHSIVLELSDPVYDDEARSLTFTARHLHRDRDVSPHAEQRVALPLQRAPAAFGGATLFIDSVDEGVGTSEASTSATIVPQPDVPQDGLAVDAGDRAFTGTIVRILQERGFGFVRTDQDGSEIFFHHSVLPRGTFETLAEGDRLAFDIELEERGRGERAKNVVVLD